MATTITKGLIGEQDLNKYDGSGTDTFSRTTSAGDSITLNKVGYEVDVLSVYGGGVTFTSATLASALTAIGSSTDCTIVLKPGTWTITSNHTITSNITLKLPKGTVLSIATGVTLTINGHFEAGIYQVFSCTGTGKVVFGDTSCKEVHPDWWTENTTPGTTDMTTAIQAAINSTSQEVFITGTNLVDCTTDLGGWAAVYGKVSFKMKSNMHLKGIKDKSIIKMKDDVSSDASPVSFNMFGSIEDLDDISFDGITFDMNGVNNLQSPLRPTYARLWSFVIVFATVNGRVDNLTVENCIFKNGPGTNVIVVGWVASGTWATLSNRLYIRNNEFIDNGMDTDDHTTIMCNAMNAFIEDNIFTSPNYDIQRNTAIQVDCPGSTVKNNYIDNYAGGIVIGENFATYITNKINISDNFIKVYFSGIWFDHPTNPAVITCGIENVIIHNNIIEIVEENSSYESVTSAFYMDTTYSIANIFIHDNWCFKDGDYDNAAYGIYLGTTTASQKSTNIHIYNNTFDYFTQAIRFVGGKGSLGFIYIKDNTCTNNYTSTTDSKGTTPAVPVSGLGIYLNIKAGQVADYVYLAGNNVYNTSTYGIYLTGTFTAFYYGLNMIFASTTADYYEDTVTITTRYGRFPSTTFNWNPGSGSLIDGAGESKDVTVPGAAFGDFVTVGVPADIGGATLTAAVKASGTVTVRIQNETTGTINFTNQTYRVYVTKPI